MKTMEMLLPMALVALLGCARLTALPAAAQPKDTVTLGAAVEPPHLDPSSHVAGSIREIVYANVFEGLMLIDQNGKEYPALAEKVDVSPDGKTYILILRKGDTFHDGTLFDSSIVKFSFDRARGPNSVNAGKPEHPNTTHEALCITRMTSGAAPSSSVRISAM
jgi:peptide/nickel transport system substrate-binding protein